MPRSQDRTSNGYWSSSKGLWRVSLHLFQLPLIRSATQLETLTVKSMAIR